MSFKNQALFSFFLSHIIFFVKFDDKFFLNEIKKYNLFYIKYFFYFI